MLKPIRSFKKLLLLAALFAVPTVSYALMSVESADEPTTEQPSTTEPGADSDGSETDQPSTDTDTPDNNGDSSEGDSSDADNNGDSSEGDSSDADNNGDSSEGDSSDADNNGDSSEGDSSDADNNGDSSEGDNGETDEPESPKYTVTGTLPVLYINTENSEEITSKEVYLQATYYLDPMGVDGVKAFGSADAQLPLQIRGRGNYTWTMLKKPYKLKLESKAALLGMEKSKQFVLLAMANVHDAAGSDFGFTLGRKLGFAWTPTSKPLELVINGEYCGLYWLTENIKIDKNRVNITEQPDNNLDESTISGGWLIELDNYDDDAQIKIQENAERKMRITYHSPEELSDLQHDWLVNEFTKINAAIYTEDKNSTEWEQYLDVESLAKYVIVQETQGNLDGYVGSWYFHKDLGENTKWIAGPLWDLSWTSSKSQYDDYAWNCRESWIVNWLPELWKFPRFRKQVMEIWNSLDDSFFDEIYSEWNATSDYIATAYENDLKFWYEKGLYPDVITSRSSHWYVKKLVEANRQWLSERWSSSVTSFHEISFDVEGEGSVAIDGYSHSTYTVEDGTSVDITFAANDGYKLQSLLLDGEDVTAAVVDGVYSLQNVDADHAFTVIFEGIVPQLSITTDNGCEIAIKSKYGATQSVIIAPLEGWVLHTVTFDGEDVTDQLVDNLFVTPELFDDAVISVVVEARTTAVDTIEGEAAAQQPHMSIIDNKLVVTNVADSDVVRIYDLDGSVKYEGNNHVISLSAGVYIAVVNDHSYKFAIR